MANFNLLDRCGTLVTATDQMLCDVGMRGEVVVRDGDVVAAKGLAESNQ